MAHGIPAPALFISEETLTRQKCLPIVLLSLTYRGCVVPACRTLQSWRRHQLASSYGNLAFGPGATGVANTSQISMAFLG